MDSFIEQYQKRGRPYLGKDARRVTISTRVKQDELEQINALIQTDTFAEVLRQAIEMWIEQRQQQQNQSE